MDINKVGEEITTRVWELLCKIYPTLNNYSTVEKYRLCNKIVDTFFNILESVSQSNKVKSKRVYYLQKADGYIQSLKFLYKLSVRNKEISKEFFREVDLEISNIEELITQEIRRK